MKAQLYHLGMADDGWKPTRFHGLAGVSKLFLGPVTVSSQPSKKIIKLNPT
jgi:hypothetical protein